MTAAILDLHRPAGFRDGGWPYCTACRDPYVRRRTAKAVLDRVQEATGWDRDAPALVVMRREFGVDE